MAFCAIPSTRNFGHLINHRTDECVEFTETWRYADCFFWMFDDLQIDQDTGGRAIVAFKVDRTRNSVRGVSHCVHLHEVMQVLIDVESCDELQPPGSIRNVLAMNAAVAQIFERTIPAIELLFDGNPCRGRGVCDDVVERLSVMSAESMHYQEQMRSAAMQAVMDAAALAGAEELGR